MKVSESAVKTQILDFCRRLNQRGWLASADGNISYRFTNENILITPTGINKAFMKAKDFAKISLSNKVKRGNPSSERLMHLEVFKKCPDARAVIHAHPPTAIAWTLAHPKWAELPCDSLSEGILALGSIPIVSYQRPGSLEMGSALRPWLPQRRALILARHGVICWGETLEEAYNGVERLEAISIILWKAASLGPLHPLPAEEIEYLQSLRKKLGDRIL